MKLKPPKLPAPPYPIKFVLPFPPPAPESDHVIPSPFRGDTVVGISDGKESVAFEVNGYKFIFERPANVIDEPLMDVGADPDPIVSLEVPSNSVNISTA